MPLVPDKIKYNNKTMVKEYFLYNHDFNYLKKERTFAKNIIVYNIKKNPIRNNTTQSEAFVRAIKYNYVHDFIPHFIIDEICSWQLLEENDVGLFLKNKENSNILILTIGDSDKLEKNIRQLLNYLLEKFNLSSSSIIFHDMPISFQFEEEKLISPMKNQENNLKHSIDFSELVSLDNNKKIQKNKKNIDIIGQIYDIGWNEQQSGTNTLFLTSSKKSFPIKAIALKLSEGELKYRVHLSNGGWLRWISDFNLLNWYSGYAGLKTFNIDGIQIQLNEESDFSIKYRIMGKNKQTDWITNPYEYALIPNESITGLEIKIEDTEGNI